MCVQSLKRLVGAAEGEEVVSEESVGSGMEGLEGEEGGPVGGGGGVEAKRR